MALTAEIHLPPGPFCVLIMPNCHALYAEIQHLSAILHAAGTHIPVALQRILRPH